MDLEVAAAEALEEVQDVQAEFARAEAGLEEQRERLASTRAEVEADASSVGQRAQELIRRSREAATAIDEDGQRTGESLRALADRITSANAEAQADVAEAREGLELLARRAATLLPHLDLTFARAEAASQALRADLQAAAARFDGALQSVKDLQEKAAGDVGRFEAALEDRLEEVHARTEGAGVPTLEMLGEAWAAALSRGVADSAGAGVSAAAANLEEVRAIVMAQLDAACEPLLQEVAALGARLEAALERLQEGLAGAQAEATAAASELEAVGEAEGALEASRAALERVKTTLAGYTFVAM